MHTALKRLAVSQKKTLKHTKACSIRRTVYQSELNRFKQNDYPIVYVDDKRFERETIRPYDYALIGNPCIGSND